MVAARIGITLAVLVLAYPVIAQADEQLMTLYPQQRAAYVEKSEERAAHYKARGEEYVNHTYATGGEEPIEPDPEFTGETAINPVPLNMGQIADIVKDETAAKQGDKADAKTSAPSDTAATN